MQLNSKSHLAVIFDVKVHGDGIWTSAAQSSVNIIGQVPFST